MTALLFLHPKPCYLLRHWVMYLTWSNQVTFTYKWTVPLWAPFLTTHCVQTIKACRLQSRCIYAAEGLVTALHNNGAERHWLRLACRLTGIHLGYPVLRGTKKILSLLQCCVRSVTTSNRQNSSLYHCVVCIASYRLGNMWPVMTELPFHTSSLQGCLRVILEMLTLHRCRSQSTTKLW